MWTSIWYRFFVFQNGVLRQHQPHLHLSSSSLLPSSSLPSSSSLSSSSIPKGNCLVETAVSICQTRHPFHSFIDVDIHFSIDVFWSNIVFNSFSWNVTSKKCSKILHGLVTYIYCNTTDCNILIFIHLQCFTQYRYLFWNRLDIL